MKKALQVFRFNNGIWKINGLLKFGLILLFFLLIVNYSVKAQTFDFETAVDGTSIITQTVSGITLTITGNGGEYDNSKILNAGGYAGSSGIIVMPSASTTTTTFTLSTAVTITGIHALETINSNFNSGGSTYTFTPNDGSGTQVIQPIAKGSGITVSFSDWIGVTSFTVEKPEGDNAGFGFDNLVLVPTVVSPPTSQAKNVNFSGTTSAETTINWTRGNGENSVVFMAATTTGTVSPVDNNTYTANTVLGAGTELGSGWYCVYIGSSNTVDVIGLTESTNYRVQVFEYNGSAGSQAYLTSTATNNPNNFSTIARPSGSGQITGITTPAAANGVYTKNGTTNGKQSWVNSNNYYVFWGNYTATGIDYWVIDDDQDINNDEAAFNNASSANEPPTTGYSVPVGSIGDPLLVGFVLNAAPVATAPSAPTVLEDAINIALADDIQISDADGHDQTVTFTITGGTLTLGTTGISFGGSGNGSASFTAQGTLAAINTALDAATFTPTANLFGTNAGTIAFTSNDGTDDSNNASVSFNIEAVNDEPSLTATGSNPTFTEDGAAASLFSSASASTYESGQTILAFICTVTNVNDGVNEILNVDGTAIALTNGTNGTTSGNSLLYSVSVVGTTATITFSGGTVTTSNMETIVEAMSYQNNSNTPTTSSNRVVTITSIQDSGGTANSGDDTAALSIASTVTVVANNDAPTLTSFTDVVETTNQNTEVEITFAELVAQGNENDVDGTVDAFIVNALSTGTLNIGASSGTAGAFTASSNYAINTSNNAYWTPASNVFGTQNAFTTTVIDNGATESTGAVQATVQVNDVTNPEVSGISLSGSPVANATTVTFIVAFTESVKNVSTDDFSLTTTGTASGTVASVSSSTGTSISVTVNTISGTGTLRLDLDASTNIADLSDNTPPAVYSSGSVHTLDRDNPTLSSSVPNDEDTGVDASANLTLTFSENIAFGTGNIQLIDLDDGSGTITINAASPGTQASISTNTLTINPASDLEESVNYAIQIAATAIDDVNGNSYAGILDNTTLNFQSADVTPPTLISSNPSDGATNMTLGGDIVLNFDDNMVAGTGNITIRDLSDNSIFEQIAVGDARVSISGNQVTINPTGNLLRGIEYYIEIDATALDDDGGNSFAGISGNSILNFTTVDVVINEVVTEPQTDWSTNNFNGLDGGGTISNGTDEWLELYVNSDGVDLSTGWTIEVSSQTFSGSLNAGGAFQTSNYVGTGAIDNTDAGDFLVLGNPDGASYMNLSTTITLKDPTGVIVDEVEFGSSPLPSSNSDNIYNESAQRYSNGSGDWTQGVATMGTANVGPSVTLSISDASIAEAAGTSTITATLSAKCSENVTVTIGANVSSTAEVSDYTLATSILITAGNLTGTTVMTAVQDLTDEINETVIIEITGVTNGTEAGVQQKTVTITDDDLPPLVTLSALPASITEAGGVSMITASLSVSSAKIVTVNLGYTGTATGSGTDYTASGSSIVIPAGSSSANRTITADQDILSEGNETVIVDIVSITNGTEDGTQRDTITIIDDDLPLVTLSQSVASFDEAAGVNTITATLGNTFSSNVEVTIGANASSTATGGGTDYTLSSTTITVFAGQLTGTATITANQELLDEDNESVIIDIISIVNGIEDGIQQVNSTVTDDDAMPTVSFTSISQSSTVESGTMTITAQLSAVSGRDVSVPFSINGLSTATGGGTDYAISASPLVIAKGTTTADITLTVASDAIDENNETVVVDMGTPTNATTTGITSHTATIDDDDPTPTVAFNSTSSSGAESVSSTSLQVDLSAVSGLDVNVDFVVTGTATGNGTDYTLANGTLTINAGDANENITIASIVNDLLDENNETVIVTLSNPANATLGTNTVHTYTINDDDPTPTVAFSSTSSSGAESVNSANLQVDLSAVSGLDVTVNYTVSGTASGSGTDFTLTNGVLTINAGDTNNNITIASIVNDLLDENNETVVLTLSDPTNATLGTNTVHTYTILDDDATPTISFTTASQNSTAETDTMTITAQLSAVSGLDVTLPFTINSGGTATNVTDYTFTASPVSILAGNTSANIIITINEDDVVEANETVIIDMGSAINAIPTSITTHTATITNDDYAILTIEATQQATEGSVDGQFTISTNKQFDSPVTVNVDVLGTATEGTDYSPIGTSVSFSALTNSINIPVDVIDDALFENDETVILGLTSTNNSDVSIAASPDSVDTIVITDDEVPPSVNFTTASQSSTDETGVITITAELSEVSGLNVTVPFTVNASSTATGNGTDYTITGSPLTITAGTTTADITITINADVLDEYDETVIVNMGAPVNATQGTVTTHTATITDDDAMPTVTFVSASQSSADESGNMYITAVLSAFSGRDVVVPYSVNGASTANGADYSISAGPLTIAAGDLSEEIIISIHEDDLNESDETVIVNIGTAVNATSGVITTHTANITDDDFSSLRIETAFDAYEGDSDGAFWIITDTQVDSPFEILFSLSGTAATGIDYSSISSPLIFPANTDTLTVTIAQLDDLISETREDVIMNLVNTNNNSVSIASAPDSTAIMYFYDNDILQLEISAPALTLSKTYDGNNTATVIPGVLTNPHPGSDVSVSATATYNDSQVGTGKTITVKYSISGSDTDMYYTPIDEVFNNGEIEAAELFVTASDETKIYGHPNPDFTISYKGFIEGEDSTVLTTLPTTMVYGNGVNVGMYPIWVIGGQAKNYKLTHISGMLDITKATLTVKADDQTKEYGDDNNQLTLTYSGWINGEEQIDIAPVLNTSINKYSPAGTYTDIIEVSGGLDKNYRFNYIPGSYSITKANLTISANTIERNYGSNNPEIKLSFSGWKNDNHFISEMPVVTTQIDRFSLVGNYYGAIILSDGSDTNYNLELINGDIIITKAPLFVSAVDQTTLINQPITALELLIDGLVNGETEDVIDIMPTAATTATTNSEPGVYPIIVSGGSDNNYSFSYQDGILTINDKQIPVITWQTPNSIEYGTSLDENQLNATTNIPGNFIYNPVAGTILDAGNTYTLSTTFTPDDEASYQVVNKTVNIDITKAEIVATAIDTTIKVGNPIPVFNINYQGFKHNDSYSDIDVLPVVSTIADNNSPAGEYELTVDGGTDNNYTFVYNNGILTIEPETSSINIAHLDAVVFPNPFKNVLNIRINSSFKASYTFSNISGQTLIQGELNKPETQIELPVLRNGVYLLDVKQNEITRTFRVVKQ